MQAVQRLGYAYQSSDAEACRADAGYCHHQDAHQQQQMQMQQHLQQQAQMQQMQQMHSDGSGSVGSSSSSSIHAQMVQQAQAGQHAQMGQHAQIVQRQLDQLQQFLLLHQQTTQQSASTESKRACISFGQEAMPSTSSGVSGATHGASSAKVSQLGEAGRERQQQHKQHKQHVPVSYQQGLQTNDGGEWHDKLQQLQHENEALKGRVSRAAPLRC